MITKVRLKNIEKKILKGKFKNYGVPLVSVSKETIEEYERIGLPVPILGGISRGYTPTS